jgi:hypothetical protein
MSLTSLLFHLDSLIFLICYFWFQLIQHFLLRWNLLSIGLAQIGEIIILHTEFKLQSLEISLNLNDAKPDILQFIHIFEILLMFDINFIGIIFNSKISLLLNRSYLFLKQFLNILSLLCQEALQLSLLCLFISIFGDLLLQALTHYA